VVLFLHVEHTAVENIKAAQPSAQASTTTKLISSVHVNLEVRECRLLVIGFRCGLFYVYFMQTLNDIGCPADRSKSE